MRLMRFGISSATSTTSTTSPFAASPFAATAFNRALNFSALLKKVFAIESWGSSSALALRRGKSGTGRAGAGEMRTKQRGS
jgi:hypothetical protein